MSATIIMPDYATALVAHLRDDPDVLAVVAADRIAYDVPGNAAMPQNRVVVNLAGGRGTIDRGPYMHARVDVKTYGTTGYEAMRLARVCKDALAPVGSSSRIVQGGVVIPEVRLAVPFLALREPTTLYPFVLAVYEFVVLEESR